MRTGRSETEVPLDLSLMVSPKKESMTTRGGESERYWFWREGVGLWFVVCFVVGVGGGGFWGWGFFSHPRHIKSSPTPGGRGDQAGKGEAEGREKRESMIASVVNDLSPTHFKVSSLSLKSREESTT